MYKCYLHLHHWRELYNQLVFELSDSHSATENKNKAKHKQWEYESVLLMAKMAWKEAGACTHLSEHILSPPPPPQPPFPDKITYTILFQNFNNSQRY